MLNLDALQEIKRRFAEINRLMAQPEVATDVRRMRELGREHAALSGVVKVIERYENMRQEAIDLREMIQLEDDAELVKMARAELETLEEKLPKVEEDLRFQLLPKDPEDAKNAIVELRAGTGGDEAALFAGDLFRMYRSEERRVGKACRQRWAW